jgi:lysophospholipase L1-like esterase
MRMALFATLVALLLLLGPARAAGPPPRSLLSVGDSLGLFTQPHLERELPRWRVAARVRPAVRATDAVRLLRAHPGRLPTVIHASLGTIDEPEKVAAFRRSVRRVMRLVGPRRCVVWANIFRPARDGIGYGRFNAVLERQAARRDNLRVVDWRAMVAANRDWLLGDAVHVSRAGYRARARAVAREVRRCRTLLRQRARRVLVNGDSLAFDSLPFIKRELPRWRVLEDVWFGRQVAEGAGVLRRYGRRLPPVIHASLGSREDPAETAAFRRSLRAFMRVAGPRRCVVWANIWRPVQSGPGFDLVNAVLADEAARRPNLRVVDWAAMVAANTHWLKPDRVHVSAAGNRARARAVAREIRRC